MFKIHVVKKRFQQQQQEKRFINCSSVWKLHPVEKLKMIAINICCHSQTHYKLYGYFMAAEAHINPLI